MKYLAFSQTKIVNSFLELPARTPPKEISGASGGFLPKPLLLRLRLPNSKKSSRVFCEILSPKNSFRKTESALKPHALPEYLEGRTPKEKHPFLFQEKIHPRQTRNARSVFSFGVAGVRASAWGFGSFVQFPLEKSSRKVYNYSKFIFKTNSSVCPLFLWD